MKVTIEANQLTALAHGLSVVGYISGVKIEAKPETEKVAGHDVVVFKVSSPSLVQADPVKQYERLKALGEHRVAMVLIPRTDPKLPFPGEKV